MQKRVCCYQPAVEHMLASNLSLSRMSEPVFCKGSIEFLAVAREPQKISATSTSEIKQLDLCNVTVDKTVPDGPDE